MHSIYHDVFCVATAPTCFIYCKARLATNDLRLVCIHSMYMTHIVASNEIIAVTKQKNIENKIIEKEIFARQF